MFSQTSYLVVIIAIKIRGHVLPKSTWHLINAYAYATLEPTLTITRKGNMKTTKQTKEPKAHKTFNNTNLKKLCGLAIVAMIVAVFYAAIYSYLVDHLKDVSDYTPKGLAAVVVLAFIGGAYYFLKCEE